MICERHAVTASDSGTCGRCLELATAGACEAFVKRDDDTASRAWWTCAACGGRFADHAIEVQQRAYSDVLAARAYAASNGVCGHTRCRGYLVEGQPECRYASLPPSRRPAADTEPPAALTEGHAYVSSNARPTSTAAANGVTLRGGTQRQRVLAALADSADDGMGLTDEEGQQLTGLHPNSYTARRLELVTAGYVEDTGDTRPTTHGARAVVWLPTLEGLAALELVGRPS